MDQLLQNAISALAAGAIYSIAALGFGVVYNATKVMNFAHGEFLMMGALISTALVSSAGVQVVLAVATATVIVTLLGIILDRYVIQMAVRKTVLTAVMITIGAGIAFRGLMVVTVGRDMLFPPAFEGIKTVTVGSIYLPSQVIWILLLLAALSVALAYLFSSTRLGKAMRAASDNPRAAMLCGIDIRAMSLVAFAIAASTGALAGAFVAPISSAFYESGLFFGLKGFAAAMLGGLGNPIGAVLGGMLIGLIETGSAGYVTSVFKDAIALGLLILVLIVKPDGLLGRAEAKRV
jgi:branched-chain amino acid transport system permease protein